MKVYISFAKKEWMESIRSYKLLILLYIFMGLACLGVFSAKYLPQLLETMMPEGIQVKASEPTAFDA